MKRAVAFFDLDRTLVACHTGRLFVGDLRRRGEITIGSALRAVTWLARYHVAMLDLNGVVARVADFLRDRSEAEMADRWHRLVETDVLPRLLPAGLRRIERHQKDGHVTALLSSAPSHILRPIAKSLGLDHALGTQFEVADGRFTGKLAGPACYGPGKISHAEQLGAERNLDIDGSWFYTDSYTDLPMLERVRHQVVVNPDPRLKRAAKVRGWPVENWKDDEDADKAA